METTKAHGGARARAGRKPVEDKKVMLSIYPQSSRVEALGLEECKRIAAEAIEKEYKKTLRK